jgi:hypothetical protein
MKNFAGFGMSEAQGLLLLIEFARAGWDDADIALREMFIERANRTEEISPYLRTYIAGIISRPINAPVGPKPATNIAADIAIAMVVFTLMLPPHNLKAQRSTRRKPSACSVAAQALAEAGLHRGGEQAIEKIWKRWGRALQA